MFWCVQVGGLERSSKVQAKDVDTAIPLEVHSSLNSARHPADRMPVEEKHEQADRLVRLFSSIETWTRHLPRTGFVDIPVVSIPSKGLPSAGVLYEDIYRQEAMYLTVADLILLRLSGFRLS